MFSPNYECPVCQRVYYMEVENGRCVICNEALHPYSIDPSLPPEGSPSIPQPTKDEVEDKQFAWQGIVGDVGMNPPSANYKSQDISPEFPNYHEKKWDKGKLELSLIPWKGVEAVGEVAMYGLAKGYKKDSWKEVPNGLQRYKEAIIRHLVADLKGEAIDKESGLFHLYHAAWNALAICHFIKEDIGG